MNQAFLFILFSTVPFIFQVNFWGVSPAGGIPGVMNSLPNTGAGTSYPTQLGYMTSQMLMVGFPVISPYIWNCVMNNYTDYRTGDESPKGISCPAEENDFR